MGHQNELPCTYVLRLTPKGTEGKNVMEVEEVGLWVVFRKDMLQERTNSVQAKKTGGDQFVIGV